MAAAAERGVPRRGSIVGREAELELVRGFVESDGPAGALVLAGSPGVGKTTLWEAGVGAARDLELRVLAARASDAEAELSFTGLGDLFEEVALDDFFGVAAPRRRALGVALLREEAPEEPLDRRAIGMALLDVLRELASRGRVIVAIDDAQWLDSASSEALVFAARRLGNEPVGFLLTRRTDGPVAVERALQPVEELDLRGLSVGATRRMLLDRLGVLPDRRLLRQIVDLTGGNPFFSLEIARTFAGRPIGARDDLPLPHNLEELLGIRISGLAPPVLAVVRPVALAGTLTLEQIEQLTGSDGDGAVDAALASDLLFVDDGHVRLAHPLLAAAVRSRIRAGVRRKLHRELAVVANTATARARHLALATDGPDETVAAAAALAAEDARARSALEDAVELGEHAVRVSLAGPARAGRVLSLADDLYRAGELRRLNELLARELEALPHGSERARGHFLLSIAPPTIEESDRHLERALEETADDPALHAVILAETSVDLTVVRLERLDAAEARGLDAHRLAGPRPDVRVLEAVAWVRLMRGRPVDDPPLTRPDDGTAANERLLRLRGIQAAFRGETARARGLFTDLLQRATDRGENWFADMYAHQLCELELRAGNCFAAARLVEVRAETYDEDDSAATRSHRRRIDALLAATRGEPDDADRIATASLASMDSFMMRWDWLESHRALGLAALHRGEPSAARDAFEAVWAHTTRERIDDPGAFPVAPDLVEALVADGALDKARRVIERLRELAQAQRHPWAKASVLRCDALVSLANGTDDDAIAALRRAAATYGALGLHFDEARTELALGRSERRRRKWAGARKALERAAEVFGENGSPGWEATAKAELARVGGRRPRSPSELTPTETRVVELAIEGLSNKEIAQRLFVTVHTVELHLSHAYAKLGVRSRAQLAGQLAQSG